MSDKAAVAETKEVAKIGADEPKYVVRNDLVWKHKKGRVVSANLANFPAGTDYDRLLLNRAIRPAMPHEYDLEVVDADAALKPGVSLTEQINEAQDLAGRVQAENDQLKTEVATLKEVKTRDYDPTADKRNLEYQTRMESAIKALNESNVQKDATIEQLRRSLNERDARKPK